MVEVAPSRCSPKARNSPSAKWGRRFLFLFCFHSLHSHSPAMVLPYCPLHRTASPSTHPLPAHSSSEFDQRTATTASTSNPTTTSPSS